MILTDVDDLVAEPVSRVIIRDPNASAEDFVELAARLGLHGTDYVVGWTAWLDLSPVGRLQGLRACEHVAAAARASRAADVLAIGDGRNDIEMLRWAGRGVAMGQAVDEVKAAADACHRLRARRRAPPSSWSAGSPWLSASDRAPGLVATDLDGTLWPLRRHGHRPHPGGARPSSTPAGVPVVFVTGRPAAVDGRGCGDARGRARPGDLLQRRDGLGRRRRRAVSTPRIGPTPGLAIVDRTRAALPGIVLRARDLDRPRAEESYQALRGRPRPGRLQSAARLEDLWDDPALKLLARHDGDPEEFWRAASSPRSATWPCRPGRRPALLEISAAGVTKAVHPRLVRRRDGRRRRDVVAFGDMPNDLPMLEWAGRVLCAMANAHPSVLERGRPPWRPATTRTVSPWCSASSSASDRGRLGRPVGCLSC